MLASAIRWKNVLGGFFFSWNHQTSTNRLGRHKCYDIFVFLSNSVILLKSWTGIFTSVFVYFFILICCCS
jgi:hypothetical protein